MTRLPVSTKIVSCVLCPDGKAADVYNFQLSNEPAEELAQHLVASSKGAFAAVGFVSGGTSLAIPARSRAAPLLQHFLRVCSC